ncbi:MAG: hypothetical protein ACUVS7_02455 [Bryobacteraceae bacterium]
MLHSGLSAAQFGADIANDFAGGPGGSFLIYSNNFGLNSSTLIHAITSARHTVTVNTGIAFDLNTLSTCTEVFLSGYVGDWDATVLTNYVNNGGNVHLAGGTGISGEGRAWDSFLANFGFEFGPSYNAISSNIAPPTSHPIFASVSSLYFLNGNSVLLTGARPSRRGLPESLRPARG